MRPLPPFETVNFVHICLFFSLSSPPFSLQSFAADVYRGKGGRKKQNKIFVRISSGEIVGGKRAKVVGMGRRRN